MEIETYEISVLYDCLPVYVIPPNNFWNNE
jgi:hypothetical protein